MSLFVCQECGCVENTNCINLNDDVREDGKFPNLHLMEMYGFNQAWEESAEYIYGEEDNRVRSPIRMLCSECNTGEWHGEWDKSLPTDVELAMAEDREDRVFTSHPLFKGSYSGKMDTYTLEQFEEDNRVRKLQDEYIDDNLSYTLNNIYDDISWDYRKPFIREEPKIGRNYKCPCGSGKKYKKCCGSRG